MLHPHILAAALAFPYPATAPDAEPPFAAIAPTTIHIVTNPGEGIDLELSYDWPDLGRVGLEVFAGVDGTGALLVLLDEAMIAAIDLHRGELAGIHPGLALDHADVLALADSIVQVAHSQPVQELLLGDERGWGCWLAGKMAGAAAGVLAAGTCAAVAGPLAPGCVAPGSLSFKGVDQYIVGKCNKAQNVSREHHV
ncbi:hypothetical protein [Nannocystis bainbridge]|uniref:Uncharacterized protein n=1 Tax=Nannocystis bainbridge TaxID=2995303 RepID=A0ABT5DSM6_9BACT|nr:hypothetical protein [Nannocystis bainbridge]MDC0716556.1 hypothetical protein [Nannocystis bainbridge]